MTTVRELDPDDAPALTALYEEYEWWEDRQVEDVRAALASTEVALGVEDGDSASGDTTEERGGSEGRRASDASGGTSGERGDSDGGLVAAARVLTDYRYYATVFDVIVAADRRGEGHGERLMAAVVDHPDLQALPGLSLLCREGLVDFYGTVGFEVYDREVAVPEGGTEELVRMTYEHDGGD